MIFKLTSEGEFPAHTLDRAAVAVLERYDWPGNVRQLENLLERAVVASDDPLISGALIESLLHNSGPRPWVLKSLCPANHVSHALPEDGPPVVIDTFVPQLTPPDLLPPCEVWSTLKQVERGHIELTLEHAQHNQAAAARLLGISRHALVRKIRKLGIARRLLLPSDQPRPLPPR